MAEQNSTLVNAPAPGAAQANTPGVPGQSATQAARDASQQPAQPQQPQLFDVKINGQNRQVTLDQMRTLAMQGGAATEKFQKAAEIERAAKEFQNRFVDGDDPIGAYTDLLVARGYPQKQAETIARQKFENSYKSRFIDPASMTEEQRELLSLKKQIELDRKYREDNEKKEQTQQQQQMEQKVRAEVEQELIQALDQAGLPKTRFTANRLVYWKKQNLKNGYDAPPEVLIQQVKDEGLNIAKTFLESSSIQQMVSMFGKEAVDKFIGMVRREDIQNLKAKLGQKSAPVAPKAPRGAAREDKGKSMRDVDKYFNDLRRSR